MLRKLRLILTNKWVLLLYPIVLLFFILSYTKCRLERNCGTLKQKDQLTDRLVPSKPDTNKLFECYLFIAVMTSPKGFLRRKAMRETWLSVLTIKERQIQRIFFIGVKGLSPLVLKDLQKEQTAYNDLIFIHDFEDSYNGLSKKLLKMLLWTDKSVSFNFMMKVDDDTFVNLNTVVRDLSKHKKTGRIYWGFFRGNSNVKKTGAWAEPDWFLSDFYLPYAMGGGYILSWDLIHYITNAAEYLQLYKSEDVSLGVWLAPVRLNRVHDVRFDTEYKSKGCNNHHIVSHKQEPEDMYDKYDQLLHHKKLCKVESEKFFTFDYNWNVPPSKCCKRVPFVTLTNTSY